MPKRRTERPCYFGVDLASERQPPLTQVLQAQPPRPHPGSIVPDPRFPAVETPRRRLKTL